MHYTNAVLITPNCRLCVDNDSSDQRFCWFGSITHPVPSKGQRHLIHTIFDTEDSKQKGISDGRVVSHQEGIARHDLFLITMCFKYI